MNTDFRYFKLGLQSRLAWAMVCYALAAFMQVALDNWLLGLAPIAFGWLFLAIRSVSNKPHDQGIEEWRAVSMGEITRIADQLKETRQVKARLGGGTALSVLFFAGCAVATIVGAASYPNTAVAFLNLGLFALPGLFFGRVTVHMPVELSRILPSFLVLANEATPEGYVLTPYLRFDKDERNMDVPENVRCLLEPKRKATDLVGVQFQVSINNGENGPVPYMYAVALTRGTDGPAYRAFSGLQIRGYHVEAGGDKEYGTVVVRQKTTGGGYHTTPDDCVQLYALITNALRKVPS